MSGTSSPFERSCLRYVCKRAAYGSRAVEGRRQPSKVREEKNGTPLTMKRGAAGQFKVGSVDLKHLQCDLCGASFEARLLDHLLASLLQRHHHFNKSAEGRP